MRRLLLIALSFLAFSANAVDDERVIKEMLRNSSLTREEVIAHYKTGCESGLTYPMRICAAFSFFAADLELNDTYKDILKSLDKEHKARLVRAQRAWIAYRDATCIYESSRGGSTDGMYNSSCRELLTKDQISRLLQNSPVGEQ
jgi:uncharacterized protein YecT (DUF1311 family)